jgi:integrase
LLPHTFGGLKRHFKKNSTISQKGSKRGQITKIMGTIRFEIRKEKKDKDGLVPIRMIYQVSGTRKYQNTGKKLFEGNWDDKNQVAFYNKKLKILEKDIKEINRGLGDLKRNVEDIEKLFILQKTPYSATMIIDELNQSKTPETKKDTSSKELYAFIDRYIKDHRHTRVKGSLSVYKALKRHLEGFQNAKRIVISFDKIDFNFFTTFQNYLFSLTKKDKEGNQVKALNDITIAKQLSTLKTFLSYAKASGLEIKDNYTSFKIKKDNDLEIIALNQQEYKTLFNLNLIYNPAWDRVRDVFCFSCATGLRYSDLKQLKREHIKGDVIDMKAMKTDHKTIIPLNQDAKTILKKYEKDNAPLPIISNQKSNEHIAKICEFAGINSPIEIVRKYGNKRIATIYKKHELIRMHCGRKTFATICAERGMRAEIIMKIGGWKNWNSFKRYLNVTDETAKEAMRLAYSEPSKKLKAV